MSKIGKKQIIIPEKVDVKIEDDLIHVKGLKGELKKNIPENIIVKVENGMIIVGLKKENFRDKKANAVWGLTRALIQNMIKGVTDGYEKVLEFQGVGYKATSKGGGLELNLGYSHPINIEACPGVEFKVEKSLIKIIGIDKELIGKIAAQIRSKRKPEPYKGSGIRYQGEIVRRKAGKKAVASG